jgi:hypothetical protein
MTEEDYFSDGAEFTEAEPTTESGAEADEAENIAILPISFFQGKDLEVGGTCTVKVESIGDDQVQVSYVSESGETGEEVEEYTEGEVVAPAGFDMME